MRADCSYVLARIVRTSEVRLTVKVTGLGCLCAAQASLQVACRRRWIGSSDYRLTDRHLHYTALSQAGNIVESDTAYRHDRQMGEGQDLGQ